MSETKPPPPTTVQQRPKAPATSEITAVDASAARTILEVVRDPGDVDSLLSEIRKLPVERLASEGMLAEGGMGDVDVVVDQALGRRIARKTLRAEYQARHDLSVFVREARVTGLLEHPHIIPVHDIGEGVDGRLYFTMKLVQGQTLRKIIKESPPALHDARTLFEFLDIVVKLCDALAFAHSRGVVHCDIKPSNVMVGDFGQVYLMDWGAARLLSPEGGVADPAVAIAPRVHGRSRKVTTDQYVVGTPSYMSPEQARGHRGSLGPRSDVFLMGALLYEMLTRKPPYDGSQVSEIIRRAAEADFPAPSEVVPGSSLPSELERIVLKAMAKGPAQRHATVLELKADLLRFVRGGEGLPRATFPAEAVVVREGDAGDAAYIIVSGRCEVTRKEDGEARSLRVLGPGDVFGEMAILTSGPRTADVVTLEETTVLVVTAATLDRELKAMKPWMASLTRTLAARFRDLDALKQVTLPKGSGPDPIRLASQILMHLSVWGERAPDGALVMSWSRLSRDLQAQLGGPPMNIWKAVALFSQLRVDLQKDRIEVRDPGRLREAVRQALSG